MFKKSLILFYLLFVLLVSLNARANFTGSETQEVSIHAFDFNPETADLTVRGQLNTECDHNLQPQVNITGDKVEMFFTADGFEGCAISFSQVFEQGVNLEKYFREYEGELPKNFQLILKDTAFKLNL